MASIKVHLNFTSYIFEQLYTSVTCKQPEGSLLSEYDNIESRLKGFWCEFFSYPWKPIQFRTFEV